jgi:hypothetical protein
MRKIYRPEKGKEAPLDRVERAYRQSCNYVTNMRKTCLFLFGKFEELVNLDAAYVRGRYRRWGTVGFILNQVGLDDSFEVIRWLWEQFQGKRHSFYRYTIDLQDDHIRLSVFISPHRVLKELLFKSGENELSLPVFLNRLNNLDYERLRDETEYYINQKGKK